MRRTKASLIYRRTKILRAVQLLLGHTKLESTVRYLGIEVDDALELAEQTEVRSPFERRICWITGFGGPLHIRRTPIQSWSARADICACMCHLTCQRLIEARLAGR